MSLGKRFLVRPGTKFRLTHHDPDDTAGFEDKDVVREILAKNVARLEKLQYLMYAESRRALLIVLQAMDAGGKDGTIRHVMEGFNPQGVQRDVLQDTLSGGAEARLPLARPQGDPGAG